ncbi:MAG: hypothetical protein AAF518_08715 [Spirochaetota bacterium]
MKFQVSIAKLKQCLLLLFLFSIPSSLFPEKIITAKEDEPDAYFGLKLGAIITPTFGYRLRDSSNGLSDTAPNDRTGFSMPWTLIMLSKEWEEKDLMMEVWGEVSRNSSLSDSTAVDGGNKSNPYILQIRRANLQKKWQLGDLQTRLIFGIQELPHVYTQWQEYWHFRYIDRAPLEILGFAPAAADFGLSSVFQYSFLQFYVGLMNGEGYKNIQNTDSSGLDIYTRLSLETKTEGYRGGLHFIARFANAVGTSGNECREGKSSCLADDGNLQTQLEKDLRATKSESAAVELDFVSEQTFHMGMGGMVRRRHGGQTYDRLDLTALPRYEQDLYGKAAYAWIDFSLGAFTLGYKFETGTGNNGRLWVFNSAEDGIFHFLNPANARYRSKQRFRRHLGFLEYLYDESVRLAISYSEVGNYDTKGEPQKVYIQTQTGELSTESAYLQQFTTRTPAGIVAYLDRTDRQLFFKASLNF